MNKAGCYGLQIKIVFRGDSAFQKKHRTATELSTAVHENRLDLYVPWYQRSLQRLEKSDYVYFVSYSRNLDIDYPLTRVKPASEVHLKQSGLSFTILRPAAFMEIWLSPAVGFDFPNTTARVFGSGKSKVGFISFADVAY